MNKRISMDLWKLNTINKQIRVVDVATKELFIFTCD